MTTNKPKVLAYHINKENPEHKGVTLEPLIRLSDYEALQAECEKLRRDAERYQWLRSGGNYDIGVVRGFDGIEAYTYEESLYSDYLDAAIDAAMQEENK